MKRLLVVLTIAVIFTIGGQVGADSSPDPSSQTLSPDFNLAETINNIPVPYYVLLDAQMAYQGYAVVTVHETRRGGQELYRLHIASGDWRRGENIYLLFDKNWQFIRDETIFVRLPWNDPVPKPEEAVSPEEPDASVVPSEEDEEAPGDSEEQDPDEEEQGAEEDEEQEEEERPIRRPRRNR